MRLFPGAALAVLATAAAQPLSFGVKAGAPLTGDIDSYWATSESKRVSFGPMAMLALPRGFAAEAEMLYRRVGYREQDSFASLVWTYGRARGNSFEFPVRLRKTLARGVYAAAGYAPRIIDGAKDVTLVQATALDGRSYETLRFHEPGAWRTTHGIVAAAGWGRRAGPIRIEPEVRYTYWTAPALDIQGSRGYSVVSPRRQVELFLGLRFR